MEKNVQFAFRCEAHLREQFIQACRADDRPAGQVLREFMREFVNQRRTSAGQGNKFEERQQSKVGETA